MIRICPSCRSPSNTLDSQCWVCRRQFDGSEPVIGNVPHARRSPRSSREEPDDYYAEGPFEPLRWRSVGWG